MATITRKPVMAQDTTLSDKLGSLSAILTAISTIFFTLSTTIDTIKGVGTGSR